MTTPDHFNSEQFSEQASRHYGKGFSSLFPDEGPTAVAPFPSASRRKHRQDYEKDKVREAIRSPQPEHLQMVDPRVLRATQGTVTRQGVSYYHNSPEYAETGRTFADQHNAGNRLPFVYSRRSLHPGQPNEEVLLAGHHRATSALLQGRQFQALRVEGDWGPPR